MKKRAGNTMPMLDEKANQNALIVGSMIFGLIKAVIFTGAKIAIANSGVQLTLYSRTAKYH